MKIGLVGWGIETKSAYQHYGPDHEYLIVNEEPIHDAPNNERCTVQTLDLSRPPGLTGNATDLSYLHGLDQCDVVITSPAAKKNLESYFDSDSALWTKLTSTMQLFFELCPTKNIIGVTGTKGKGTTSSLIHKMLQQAGITAHLAGNIGTAVLDILPTIDENDWVVLELSNFQLYNFPYSPHIAVHLMMMPEHIAEWHKTMDDYVAAKRNIFAHQSTDDIAIYYPDNPYSTSNASTSPGRHIPYMQEGGAMVIDNRIEIQGTHIIDVHDIALKGRHNLQNVCAAITAAWQVTQDDAAIRSAIKTFTGLEHRLQIVRVLDSITYVDDSFGTTPDTALVAMDAFRAPKVVIVGGHDKGSDYGPLVERLEQDDIRHAICIGPVGNWIAERLDKDKATHNPDANDWTMTKIVELAKSWAEPNDIVLLSCGSSSFGIFTDYKDRGNQFIAAVNQL